MNRRRLTTELSVDDIKVLEAALRHARIIGHPFNSLITFAPFRDCDDVPTPEVRTKQWRNLQSYLSMWAKRRAFDFTAIWVWHAAEDGRNPHIHIFAHLPTSRRRDELRIALLNVYPEPRVIDVRAADDFLRRHSEEGYGSILGYMIRFMSQQAYGRFQRKGTPLWRASRREQQKKRGRIITVNRGIKAPIIGKRFGITRNINACAQENQAKARTHIRIAAERQMIAARSRRPVGEGDVIQEAA